MSALGLKFRIPDLSELPRAFRGEIPVEALDEVLVGLVGDLGYRAKGTAAISGNAYLAERDVVVDGEVKLSVGYDCVRCVEGLEMPVALRFSHVIAPRPEGQADKVSDDDELVVDAEDDGEEREEAFYEGEEVDLTALMREDILLELPMNPTCEHTAAGRCDRYDEVLPEAAPGSAEAVDPRWAPLLEMKRKMNPEG